MSQIEEQKVSIQENIKEEDSELTFEEIKKLIQQLEEEKTNIERRIKELHQKLSNFHNTTVSTTKESFSSVNTSNSSLESSTNSSPVKDVVPPNLSPSLNSPEITKKSPSKRSGSIIEEEPQPKKTKLIDLRDNPIKVSIPSKLVAKYIFDELSQLDEKNIFQTVFKLSQCKVSEISAFNSILRIFDEKKPAPRSSYMNAIFQVVFELSKHFGKQFANNLKLKIAHYIISNLVRPSSILLCELFVRLCQISKELDRVRVFCFDLLREENNIQLNLLCMITSIWSQILYCNANPPILLTTIQTIVCFCFRSLNESASIHFEQQQEIERFQLLKKNCGWSFIATETSLEELTEALLQKLKQVDSENKDLLFNLYKSFELLGAFQGWLWTYNTLIKEKLWPFLNPNEERLMCVVLRLFGFLSRILGNQNFQTDTGVTFLCNPMKGVLEMENFSMKTKLNACESLLDFTFVGCSSSKDILVKWLYSHIKTEEQKALLSPSLVHFFKKEVKKISSNSNS